jgi:hypothetical protein
MKNYLIHIWYLIFLLPSASYSSHSVCTAPLFTVTDSISTSSFRLNWTDFNPEVEGWEIEWGEKGFDQTEIPTTGLIVQSNMKINGLRAGKSYDFYIRAVCNESEKSEWNGPFRARTAIDNNEPCELVLDIRDNNCPRLEDFYIEVNGFEGQSLGTDVFIQSVDIIIEHDWPADLQMYLTSPGGKRVLLSKNRGIGLDNYGNPSDTTCVDVTSFSDFACTPISEVGTEQLIGTFLPEENISLLYDDGSVNGLWKLSMCDRALEDRGILKHAQINLAPVICNVPTEIVARNVSDVSATIQWSPFENCRVAIINVVLSGQSPGTNIEIFTSCQGGTFEVTGLEPETAYDIYIRSDCNSSKSAFSCPASFVTACNAVTLSTGFEGEPVCVESCNADCSLNGTWTNIKDDTQDWVVHRGATVTDNTGPDGDISGVGNYIYLENTIDLCGPRNTAVLEATCLQIADNTGPCDMSFYYHMYGDDVDSLSLLISNDNGNNWTTIFAEYGNMGKVWRREFVDLSPYAGQLCSFRFLGISGSDDRADIALDQIEFYGTEKVTTLPVFYFDLDNDGYGGQDSIISLCLNDPPAGFKNIADDCDDSNANIHPGATEIQCNLIDENCNGNDDDAEENNPITYDIISIENESCPGASDASITLTISGGNPPYDVTWNNGIKGVSLNNISENVYFATITDAGSCSIKTAFIDIDVLSSPQIFFVSSQPSRCNESTGSIDIETAGGVSPYTYTWNNGSVSQDLIGISEGTYSVTASDANGCEVVLDKIIIESSPRFTAGIQSQKNLACFGDSNGIVSIGIFNAVEPITYHWNNGDTTQTINQLPAGEYTVTINDARGCEEIISTVVSSPAKLNSEITGIEQITCYNGSNGSIQVNTSGGIAPYSFNWTSDPPLSFSQSKQEDITGLKKGQYKLEVSDGRGCTDTTQTVILTNPVEINVAMDSINPVRCKLSLDGYLSVDVKGGAGEYSYFWANVQSTDSILQNIAGGTYSLTVIDKFGCKKTVNDLKVGINNEPLLLTSAIEQDNVCSYDSVGQIITEVIGGKAPFDYNWSSGRQTIKAMSMDTIKNLAGGIYKVTITDGEGCVGISEPQLITKGKAVSLDDIALVLNNCNNDQNGAATITASGGSPPYLYQWNTGANTASIDNLANGNYFLTITDADECTFEFGPITISSENPIKSGSIITHASGGADNGSIRLNISGGSPPYDINWDNLPDNIEVHNNLSPGTYCVTITDEASCVLQECFIIDRSDSVEETLSRGINIFPNPVNQSVSIEAPYQINKVTLINSKGQFLITANYNSTKVDIDVSHLPKGIYLVKIIISNIVITRKIIKL